MSIAHTYSPYASTYPWSSITGFGIKYSDPSTLPDGNGKCVSFDSDSTNISIVHNISPYVSNYAWSSGFGTRYSNPGTLPTGIGYSTIFNTSVVISTNIVKIHRGTRGLIRGMRSGT